MFQSISYCSNADAGRMVACTGTGVLCVSEGQVPDCIFQWRAWLCLHLPSEEDSMDLWRKLDYQAVELFEPIYGDLPHQIRCFLEQLQQQDVVHLLVCCPSGRTRSAAIALYVADLLDLPFDLKDGRYNRLLYETLKAHGPHLKKKWLRRFSSTHPLLMMTVKGVFESSSSGQLSSKRPDG